MKANDQGYGSKIDDLAGQSPQALREALENVRVHQIELEMQNDELRRNQAAMDTAEARYFDFYDLAPVGYVTVSDKSLILQANLTAATLLGLPRADLIGKALPGFMPAADADRYYLLCRQAIATARVQSCELCLRQSKGDVVWVSLQAIAAAGDDGTAVIRMVLSDITQRLQIEQAAKEAGEEKFRLVSDNTSDGIVIFGADRRIQYVSPAYVKQLGYSEAEERNRSPDQIYGQIHPEDRDALFAQIEQAIASKASDLLYSYRIRHRLGHTIWREDHARFQYDGAGSCVGTCVVARDITKRKQAEEALQHTQSLLADAEKIGRVGGWEIDVQTLQTTWTEGVYDIYELDRTDRLTVDEGINYYTPESQQIIEQAVQRAIEQGEPFDLELEIISAKGNLRNVHAVGKPDGARGKVSGFFQDITERKAAEQKINALAFYDQLTGLPNRILLADRLKQTLTASSRNRTSGALLFIDLDHFKTLNDTQGHDMGDLQLKQVATRLSSCVREGDTVARVGGDEFVVILAGLSESEVEAATETEAVAAKILSTLSQPYQMEHVLHRSSASIGATLFQGTRTNIDDLMKQADIAMYRAKDAGRNAVRFFDPSMEMAVVKRAALEKDLRNAVEQKQFVLHYQAQVEGAGSVSGAEVLVRWLHPQRGMVSPADFIPLAEETGVILALGHWVLETACSHLEKWARVPGMAHLTLAVNVSAVQFAQSDFVEQVMSVVQRAGANPQRLKLELTEGLLVGNVDDTIGKMKSLKASGIGFSLDDFGTGYSSLAYLSRLPLDQLKIDKSFVNDVVTNPDDAAIAKTIIALAQSLRLGVTAEGVETDAQREFLASAGCHAYQGYFFSRPLPLEGYEAFVSGISMPTTAPAI